MSGNAVRFALSGSDFSKLLLAFIYYLWIYSFMICSQISLDPVWKAGTITANQSILRVSIRRKCSARIFCRSVAHFLIGQIFELFTTSGYKWVYSFQFCCVSTQQHRATEEILLLSIHISTGWRTKHAVVLQRESWDDLHGKHVFENYCWIFKGWAFWPQHSSFSRGNDCNWFNVASVRRTQTTDGLFTPLVCRFTASDWKLKAGKPFQVTAHLKAARNATWARDFMWISHGAASVMIAKQLSPYCLSSLLKDKVSKEKGYGHGRHPQEQEVKTP